MESFFASLKKDLVFRESFATRADRRAVDLRVRRGVLQPSAPALVAGVRGPGDLRVPTTLTHRQLTVGKSRSRSAAWCAGATARPPSAGGRPTAGIGPAGPPPSPTVCPSRDCIRRLLVALQPGALAAGTSRSRRRAIGRGSPRPSGRCSGSAWMAGQKLPGIGAAGPTGAARPAGRAVLLRGPGAAGLRDGGRVAPDQGRLARRRGSPLRADGSQGDGVRRHTLGRPLGGERSGEAVRGTGPSSRRRAGPWTPRSARARAGHGSGPWPAT